MESVKLPKAAERDALQLVPNDSPSRSLSCFGMFQDYNTAVNNESVGAGETFSHFKVAAGGTDAQKALRNYLSTGIHTQLFPVGNVGVP